MFGLAFSCFMIWLKKTYALLLNQEINHGLLQYKERLYLIFKNVINTLIAYAVIDNHFWKPVHLTGTMLRFAIHRTDACRSAVSGHF